MPAPLVEMGLLEPKEAVAFFRQKGYRISFDYRDVWRQEHQAAFTVAKVAQMDLLADIRAAVDAAIINGTPFKTFARQLMPEMMQRGWWGKAMMVDPQTGEEKRVQLGSVRRLKTIYNTNLRTAHSEGQWARILDSADTLPYLMYDHTPSKWERKEHAAWDGLILPVTHPFWQTHNTPCGWGCKCRRQQLTAEQAAAMGGESQAPNERWITYTNKRTGETIELPAGVDPAFAYPPGGRLKHLTNYLASRVETMPTQDSRIAVVQNVNQELETWMQAPAGDWPLAVLPKRHADLIGAETSILRLSADTMKKQAAHHPELTASDYQCVQDVLLRGEVIPDTDKSLVFALNEKDGYVTVVKATKTGRAVFMTSLRKLSGNAEKREREIVRLHRKGDKNKQRQ